MTYLLVAYYYFSERMLGSYTRQNVCGYCSLPAPMDESPLLDIDVTELLLSGFMRSVKHEEVKLCSCVNYIISHIVEVFEHGFPLLCSPLCERRPDVI